MMDVWPPNKMKCDCPSPRFTNTNQLLVNVIICSLFQDVNGDGLYTVDVDTVIETTDTLEDQTFNVMIYYSDYTMCMEW